MLEVLDGPKGRDDWAIINWDTEQITYDISGGEKPFTTQEVIFTRGKYAGLLLSEVTDSWYLKFIKDKNPDDYLITFTFDKRLDELAI